MNLHLETLLALEPMCSYLLDMDMTEITEPLGLASTSSSLKASTVKFSFSALELLEGLEHLLISDSNLSAVAKMDIMPTFVSLLLNGNPPEKRNHLQITLDSA